VIVVCDKCGRIVGYAEEPFKITCPSCHKLSRKGGKIEKSLLGDKSNLPQGKPSGFGKEAQE